MSGRRIKRLKVETVTPDSGMNPDDNAIQALPELPAEIWTLILELDQNAEGQRKDRNKRMTQLQLVSKQWCGIIKNNIYFEPRITDQLLNGTIRFENVRAKKIILANLTMEPSFIAQLYKPEIVREITLCQNVNKSNFLSIANHFSEHGYGKTLIITQEFLDCEEADWFSVETQEEIYILRRFWNGITKLVLDVPMIDLQSRESRRVINLETFFRKIRLPNLKEFKLTAHWSILVNYLSISFLQRHASSLTLLDLKLADLQYQMDWHNVILSGSPKQLNPKDLEYLQLKNISLDGKAMCQVGWHMWIPLLQKQRGLRHLNIGNVNGCELKKSDYDWSPLNFQSVTIIALDNFKTLTSLHLVQYHFVGQVDLTSFQYLKNLKTLTLDKKDNRSVAKLVNMTCLPKSLENFTVRGLACEDDYLEELARAPHLNKLRYLELGWIGSPQKNDKIPEQIIQTFLEKKSLQRLHLSPVVISRVWTEGNRQYFIVGRKGYLVPLPSDFLEDYENVPFINFTIDCTDVKMGLKMVQR